MDCNQQINVHFTSGTKVRTCSQKNNWELKGCSRSKSEEIRSGGWEGYHQQLRLYQRPRADEKIGPGTVSSTRNYRREPTKTGNVTETKATRARGGVIPTTAAAHRAPTRPFSRNPIRPGGGGMAGALCTARPPTGC